MTTRIPSAQGQTLANEVTARLFQEAAKRPSRTPCQHLAAALGRAFHPCEALVRWKDQEAALWEPKYRNTQRVGSGEVEHLEKGLPLNAIAERGSLWYESFGTEGSSTVGLAISQRQLLQYHSQPPGVNRLLMVLDLRRKGRSLAKQGAYFDWFRTSVQDLQTLFNAFVGLCWSIEATRISARIASLTLNPGLTVGELLREARSILSDLKSWSHPEGAEPILRLTVQLAANVLLEMLGRGWDVENQEGQEVTDSIRGFIAELPSAGDSHRYDLTDAIDPQLEISALGECLRAVLGDAVTMTFSTPESPSRPLRLGLLAQWTSVHQLTRRVLRSRLPPGEYIHVEQEMQRVFRLSLPALAEMLVHYSGQRGKHHAEDGPMPIDRRLLDSWLHLWFCYQVVGSLGDDPSPESGPELLRSSRWRLYSNLAYIIRESLRSLLFGHHSQYLSQPAVFSAAMRSLVEFHAIEIVGLSKDLDLRQLLEHIGRISLGGGAVFATGHLQHALETYIVGHFLCELRIIPEGRACKHFARSLGLVALSRDDSHAVAGFKLIDLLASSSTRLPGGVRRAQLLRAFSLAALFHDVGMVLFPYWTHQTEGLARVDPSVARMLSSVRDALRNSATEFLQECVRVLTEGGYLREGDEESRLRIWLAEVVERGNPDHCVLGAWYVHRLCGACEGLPREVTVQAVRAVLLHRAITQSIDPDSDPAAALLVLCDQLMMWVEGHEPPQPDDFGRYFQAIAGGLRSSRSPFEKVWVLGLDLDLKNDQLFCALRLNSTSAYDVSGREGWPRFRVNLRHPDQLPLSIHHLWLTMSQNLGRVKRSLLGFAPFLEAYSEVPHRPGNLTTRELLERVADHASIGLRRLLDRWLETVLLLPPDDEGREGALIQPLDWLPQQDFEEYHSELERLVREVIYDEERRSHSSMKPGS